MSERRNSFRGKVGADAERSMSQGNSFGYLKLPQGLKVFSPKPATEVLLDFLPYIVKDDNHPDKNLDLGIALKGDLWYKRPFKVHNNVGPDQEKVVCPTSVGKRCPICDYKAKRAKEGAKKEELEAMYTSQRVLYIVVPLALPEREQVPHLMDISFHNFQKQLNLELKSHPKYEIFPDLEEGYSLNVRFISATAGTSKPFPQANRIDFEARPAPWDEAVLKVVPNLDELLTVLSFEELHSLFFNADIPVASESQSLVADPEPAEEHPSFRRRHAPESEPETAGEAPYSNPLRRGASPVQDEKPADAPPRRRAPMPPAEEPATAQTNQPRRRGADPAPAAEKPTGKDRCPFGHRFGVDIDEFKDCEKCDLYDPCGDVKDGKTN